MSHLETLQAGSRHDLHVGISPDAPDESLFKDETEGAFGYAHSYETSSRYDGPGMRVVLFVSGCLLRCTYCHNPDTWHLKDGTYVAAQQVVDRLAGFAPALRALDGGLTISGGEPMVQLAFTKRILAGAKSWGCIRPSRLQAFSVTVLMSHIFQSWISFSSTSKARTLIRIAP
jgi:pyruvate formate lyase activating enzyme